MRGLTHDILHGGLFMDNTPLQITAKAKVLAFTAPAPVRAQLFEANSSALPAQKLWLSVVLQALAERDPANVVTKNRGKEGTRRKQEKLAKEAEEFVNSEEFAVYCRAAGIQAKFARSLTPQEAAAALERLRTGTSLEAEIEPDEEQDLVA